MQVQGPSRSRTNSLSPVRACRMRVAVMATGGEDRRWEVVVPVVVMPVVDKVGHNYSYNGIFYTGMSG